MQLPVDLRDRIEEILSAEDRQRLSSAYDSVSRKYRRKDNAQDFQIANADEAKAYLATRFPATWCAVADALEKFQEIVPGFAPVTSLDLGAGPATATLAALHSWPSLSATLVEPNAHLRGLGQQLLPSAKWNSQKIQSLSLSEKYDLVIASYVFNEIPDGLAKFLDMIWENTQGAFLMIEPGTPQGYQTILSARTHLLSLGAHIAAPCPHEDICPLAASERWCHFSVRVDRSRLHRQVKPDATLSYEDEKYSYLIATRNPAQNPLFRALGEPHGQKVISLETCHADGRFDVRQVSKRDEDYKLIKKMNWGDASFESHNNE